MKQHLRKTTALIILALFVGYAGSSCRKETEADKVKKVIVTVQKAAEEKNVRAVLATLSKNYRDAQGNDYDAIKGLLLAYFFRHQKIHVYIPNIEVAVQPNGATAVFDAVLSGGTAAGSVKDIVPESLGVYTFDISLQKENGDWKVLSAKWERTGTGQERS